MGVRLTANATITSSNTNKNRYLYVAVFFAGMTTLAIELSASRLLGSVFGTSNLVWANVIGLILLYLTIGYFIGGWLADRSPYHRTLYLVIAISGFVSAFIPLVSTPVLTIASRAVVSAQAGLVIGSFIAVLVLFSLPITLLGMVSPFAIRLAVTDVASAGHISGRIYAISTLGSLIGTFLPNLVVIPLIGTTRTFLLFAGILFIVGAIGLLTTTNVRRTAALTLWMPIVIGLVAWPTLNQPIHSAFNENFTVLYEGESAYNYVQVQEDINGYRYLFLNEGQGIHSQWHPEQITYQRTWSFFLAAPYFNHPPYTPNQVDSLAVIGLAAGTIPRQYQAVYGDMLIDGIEIDPLIIEVGEQFFGMNQAEIPGLTTYAQDGRYILNQLDREYDVVAIDAYRPPYIPWHLTTVEFFEEVQAHLAEDGVVAINVGRTATDRRLIDALTATLLQVYPSVHAMDVPNTFNTILVATNQPTRTENLNENTAALPPDTSPLLRDALQLGVESLTPTHPSDLIFTDDKAPVEQLVDSIVINFLVNGDLDQIR